MKTFKEVLPRAAVFFLIFSAVCGILYTAVITGAAQALFSDKANGSIIEVNGKKYGSELLGQQYTDEKHMWGRIMNIDTSTYIDDNGQALVYAAPSNINPASAEYEALVAERTEKIRAAHPEKGGQPIPVDLVTCSGSGLDPHISVAAARYQADRIASRNNMTADEVNEIIDKYTTGRFLGIFGEPVVNVLKVNLALDGILTD
ncbi:potassium-transporting ATPase subunit KdpC [Murimonas intestini]|uniref:Potassium-transporting ATPase KdpC subunit n=1 Tax=Murimonas intestini TaxID=1337051 RepID=A0AB73T1E8_9FIRM|nr:potassium-transporting ATPase subunit KdpC [Murimonas intestini]MCR1840435.1 potassium-transporting ATPase subunit KdpC [Murimonas intestini]MCR1867454.1 potassium-transporting ATPase subunit KdpC [Murimonas intestini]MCR1884641.1 potassium-transporting ATPase subunit KdpC [Murimonas intestini]